MNKFVLFLFANLLGAGLIHPPMVFAQTTAKSSAPLEVKKLPLDFTLQQLKLSRGVLAYGWELMPWASWLNRPTSGPLYIDTSYNKNNLEVFEARAATIIARPIQTLTEQSLHNLETVRKLSPSAHHQLVQAPRFTVESMFTFPPSWSEMIKFGKRTTLLDEKTTDFIQMTSTFGFADAQMIASSQRLQRVVALLDIVGRTPDAMNFQGSTQVNQIANAISIVTLFYKVDDRHTLMVSHMAITLKKHILNLGVNSAGLMLNGRGVLLGENPAMNSSTGIGAGLPKFAQNFFAEMAQGLER